MWESGGVRQSWVSPWPGLTRGGWLRWLEEKVLCPAAPACGAAALRSRAACWEAKRRVRQLSAMNRGEQGVSEKEKEALL
jgi:hypothetical protein